MATYQFQYTGEQIDEAIQIILEIAAERNETEEQTTEIIEEE